MPLTDTAIRSAKPEKKTQKLFDGGGLYLEVAPSGGKWWRLKYRFEGREKRISLGVYPDISLKDARRRRDESKKLIARGIDPSEHRKASRAAIHALSGTSYEVVAREWFAKYSAGWSESNGVKVLARQVNYIFPFIGGKPIKEVTAPELLEALRHIEKRGSLDTAHRALQDCSRVFRYAIATGRGERDTAADLRGALPPAKGSSFATITEPKAVGALLRAIEGYGGGGVVASALRLAPLVFVRPGELRQAEWSEFDLDGAEWRIPPERMKMRQLHIVPLARQTLEILRQLHPFTGYGRFLFPSPRTGSRPISDVALLAALRRMGYSKEEMTVHGFRSMASTLLNEQGYNRDWIERQLAHGERNSIRAAYNYAEYLPERRRMMQEWADYLDELRGV
ncbi:integrase arm-type DNA-binding domain-containing protein [Desulfovibrio sp. OttesenSCG-928-G11]|nr:integrase arm-type DNA-binding domain-containing protein [Desulfovibrio sp. OttesenSCG-928-G11]